jgi:hypothetical protein
MGGFEDSQREQIWHSSRQTQHERHILEFQNMKEVKGTTQEQRTNDSVSK